MPVGEWAESRNTERPQPRDHALYRAVLSSFKRTQREDLIFLSKHLSKHDHTDSEPYNAAR